MAENQGNQRDEKMRIGAVVAAIAGLAGYLTGILTAPKSGKRTRQDIADAAIGAKKTAEQQLESANKDLKDLLKTTRSNTVALSSQAREEFNEAVVRAKDAKNRATSILKAFKSGTADDPQLNKAIKQAKQAQKNLAKYLKGETEPEPASPKRPRRKNSRSSSSK